MRCITRWIVSKATLIPPPLCACFPIELSRLIVHILKRKISKSFAMEEKEGKYDRSKIKVKIEGNETIKGEVLLFTSNQSMSTTK